MYKHPNDESDTNKSQTSFDAYRIISDILGSPSGILESWNIIMTMGQCIPICLDAAVY
jgi:hypothetical protein